MSNAFEKLTYYFSFPFVRYALIVGVLIALCSALLGVVLVLRRFSFIGDGLSHTAFGALALATVLGVSNELTVVLPVTAVLAVFLLKAGSGRKVKGDAALAMVSVGSLAIGYLLLNVFPTSANVSGDVCGTLFGATSILTLSRTDVVLCTGLSALVVLLFVLFYNRIFSVTFDESFAEGTGLPTKAYNSAVAVVTAVVIVLAMKLAGSLLISALVVFPALSAMRVFKSFRSVIICAAAVGAVCAALGILVSLLASLPVGPSVVAVNLLCFAAFYLAGRLAKR